MLGRPLNINQMYKYFYTNILSYKRTILGGGSTTFQLFIFKDHPSGYKVSSSLKGYPQSMLKATVTYNSPQFIFFYFKFKKFYYNMYVYLLETIICKL